MEEGGQDWNVRASRRASRRGVGRGLLQRGAEAPDTRKKGSPEAGIRVRAGRAVARPGGRVEGRLGMRGEAGKADLNTLPDASRRERAASRRSGTTRKEDTEHGWRRAR